MTIEEIAPYFDFNTRVKIVTKDHSEFIGMITGVDDSFDTYSGNDEIELDMGTYYLSIEISDITEIIALKGPPE
ncbi:hypothetical protein [uncultured Ruminococcus sp.]|uniref:hypothetical protein n=1 Tax=uncultured Ruminococcus sp. TaxID=165186 RepID=UPI0025D29A67|nr:hypothetical protein [uncultured Ruminococcus sp.]